MLDEISDVEVFSELMIRAIPLEVLWAMEYEQEDDYLFVEPEKSAFKYLRIIAQFYLEETQKYEDLLEQSKEKDMKKQKTKKKISNNNK